MKGKRKILLLALTTASLAMGIIFFNTFLPESAKLTNPMMELSNMVYKSIKDTNNTVASPQKTSDINPALQALPYVTVNVTDDTSPRSEISSNYFENYAQFFEIDVLTDAPNRLLNEHNYEFTLDTKACRGDELVVTLVHTALGNFDKRMRIRNTWGSVKGNATLVAGPIFLIGQFPSTNDNLQEQIEQESVKYGDIVQGNFDDSYRNITYKSIMGLHWVRQSCNRTKFMLKVDDDVLVNMNKLLDRLNTMKGVDTNLIWCQYVPNPKPSRSADKFKLTLEEYPLETFPPYCSGCFYVMSNDVTAKLYDASRTVIFFWIEDVLVTGALPLKVGIQIKPCTVWTSLNQPPDQQSDRIIFFKGQSGIKNWQPTWDRIRLINNHTVVPNKKKTRSSVFINSDK